MANLIYENLKVNNHRQLNNEDYRSLTLLYLPLIGVDSFAVYSVLNSIEPEETYNFKKLLDILNFTSMNILNQAINKLEGVGLIKTYYNETKGYYYEILLPLSFRDFQKCEVLNSLLLSAIGQTEYDKLFLSKSTRVIGYKNVTKKFNEVFKTTERSINTTVIKLFKDPVEVENNNFNYTLFKILFDDNILSEDVLNNKEFRENIEKISFVYHLNEEEMKEVIVKTIDIDKSIEYSAISKNARLMFSEKNDGSIPRIETVEKDSFIASAMDDEMRELLLHCEAHSISETLYSISGVKPSVAEISQFEKLQKNTGFSTGVINLMILYVNGMKNGELPSYNYFEKLANVWARAKVKNSYDALKYINEHKNRDISETDKENKVTKTKEKSKKPTPDWYKEYTENLDKKYAKEDIETDDEELKKLAEELFK